MKKVIRVVVRLRGRSALAKLDQARYVVARMTANANFPTLTGQVTALGTSADTLEAAITEARTGSHEAVGNKQLAEDSVMDGLSKLCDSVNGVAGGDMAKLLTSGFPLRRENHPIGELNPPVALVSRLTNTRGRVVLEWEGEEGAHVYNVFMSTTSEPLNWVLVGNTTKQKYNADGLVPGNTYWFSVTAVGTAGESSKSEPARTMAAA